MELKDLRYLICTECDKFNHTTKFCRVCKCFMPLKTKFKAARCPKNKWLPVTDNVNKRCGACGEKKI